MPWPWTLTFWPQNLIRSSLSPDAPVTKVWRKSVDRYWRYRGNIKIWDVFGHAVTLTFDLLTPKCNLFISVPRCTSDKSLAKIRQQILEISQKQNYHVNHGRTHGRTTRKHIASTGAYWRRRLKKQVVSHWFISVLVMCSLDNTSSMHVHLLSLTVNTWRSTRIYLCTVFLAYKQYTNNSATWLDYHPSKDIVQLPIYLYVNYK